MRNLAMEKQNFVAQEVVGALQVEETFPAGAVAVGGVRQNDYLDGDAFPGAYSYAFDGAERAVDA